MKIERMAKIAAEIELHMARAFFASAWADACEESGNSSIMSGKEIMSIMPDVIDPAAIHAANTLRMDMESKNGYSIVHLYAYARKYWAGDRKPSAEMFGHYCAMQSMGTGVGLYDAFGKKVHDTLQVPYCEFGQHSLEKDYFQEWLYVALHATRPDGTRDTFQTVKVPAKDSPLWWQEKGLSFTASGYGARIPTTKMVLLNGKWRRVYCRVYSNAGTCYIGKNLQTGFIVSEG